jgi:hypothetical protein
MPVILTIQEAVIRRIEVQSQPPGKQFVRTYLENTQHRRGLVEWFNW